MTLVWVRFPGLFSEFGPPQILKVLYKSPPESEPSLPAPPPILVPCGTTWKWEVLEHTSLGQQGEDELFAPQSSLCLGRALPMECCLAVLRLGVPADVQPRQWVHALSEWQTVDAALMGEAEARFYACSRLYERVLRESRAQPSWLLCRSRGKVGNH